jgi:hypothetical protein
MYMFGILQLSLYTRFREQNAGVEIGLQSFEALKPWYVKRLKESNSCCCRYHVQMAELKDAFNLMRRGTLHRSCTCGCAVCGVALMEVARHRHLYFPV